MTHPDIAHLRLRNQRIGAAHFQKPAEVVAWLGAVQAQDYMAAKWGLGLRLQNAVDRHIEAAFKDGTILRTHIMRPTWHFVTPADIRWILALTAPRVNAANAYMFRKLELDEALFARSNTLFVKALANGGQLTRLELAGVLAEAGIVADGIRLGYIVHRAELDAVVCSGARRGKQFTYALVDERAPEAKTLSREEALVELTKRYFTSHGPALVKDFAWWSGLTQADVMVGLDMAKSYLARDVINRQTYWFSPSSPSLESDISPPTVYLLPPYDEFTIAYKDHSAILHPAYIQPSKTLIFGGVIVIDGKVAGYWRRTFSKKAVVIETTPFRPLSLEENEAMAAAAARYSAFLEMPLASV
jgi:hypothetical protein